MSNLPAPPPLLDIINRLQSEPINNTVTRIQERMKKSSDKVVVLADLSVSMNDYVGNSGKTKLEMLRTSLEDLVKYTPEVIIVGFSDKAFIVQPTTIGRLHTISGTNLTEAFQFIKAWNPRKTIVISDGYPDNPRSAQKVAELLSGTIDIVYCGSEDDDDAVEFMQSLCKISGGRVVKWDMVAKAGIEDGSQNPLRALMPPGMNHG